VALGLFVQLVDIDYLRYDCGRTEITLSLTKSNKKGDCGFTLGRLIKGRADRGTIPVSNSYQ